MNSTENNKNLAQLRNAVDNFFNPRIIEKILSTGVDVNHKFASNSHQSYFTTLLHIAATKSSPKNFQILLSHGADVTIVDSDGLTPLHRVLVTCLSNNAIDPRTNPFISAALSSHVVFKNSANPQDDRGFTHFHGACLTNHSDALQFFLNNLDVHEIDRPINEDSAIFPGYTPLHFAARFACVETAVLLVDRRAKLRLKDTRGLTAVQVLVQRKIKMLDDLLDSKKSEHVLLAKIYDNETILRILLDSDNDDIGMSRCHAICTLQKSTLVAEYLKDFKDIDSRIDVNSVIWPGYSMLHFAAHCNVSTMILLLNKGADIHAKDVNGLTPLDICVKWCKAKDVYSIVSAVGLWKDVVFSDGRTKLLDCIAAMDSLENFVGFLKNVEDPEIYLSESSALWPGSTLLHLSVMLADRKLVEICLNVGCCISHQDTRGRTATHLAFRSAKSNIVDMLLPHHRENCQDDENLSLLHITLATKRSSLGSKACWLFNNDIDVNLVYTGSTQLTNVHPGWTALHVAVSANVDASVVETLLDRSADPYILDKTNMTAINLLFVHRAVGSKLAQLLLSLPDFKECPEAAFSHLHVASYFDDVAAVEKLLYTGTDVNTSSRLFGLNDCTTALHVAMNNKSIQLVEILVCRGADILAGRPNGLTPLAEALTSCKCNRILNTFVGVLRADEMLRQRVKVELGLTMLHVVCRVGQLDAMEDLLNKGADVNAKINDHATFWPGWTPLHVLVIMGAEMIFQKKQKSRFKKMMNLLLDRGADMMIANEDGDTPLHLMLKKFCCKTEYYMMTELLSRQQHFSVNPANKHGATHFHAACLANDHEAIRRFLSECDTIDVDQPIDFFADYYAGSTPLHLALNSNSKIYFGLKNQLRVLDLLLKYKPNLNSEDDLGYTPLHVASDCNPSCFKLLKTLVDNGANMQARSIDGKTAFEILLSSKEISTREIELFIKRNYRVNGSNPMSDKGYLAIILNERDVVLRTNILNVLIDTPSVLLKDDVGRTAVHNIVATDDLVILEHDYVLLIEKLIKLGCDVNEQDDSGKTALHLALIFRNEKATTALLICGSDLNIVDIYAKTPFTYALESCSRCFTHCNTGHDYLLKILVHHVTELKARGLYVNEQNEAMKAQAMKNRWIKNLKSVPINLKCTDDDYSADVDRISIGTKGWMLSDFLTEHGAVHDYHLLTRQEKILVDNFFENIDYHRFRQFRYMLKIQYRQAVARGGLLVKALDSIAVITGLPYLCNQMIVWYLRNPDLKNLIAAVSLDN